MKYYVQMPRMNYVPSKKSYTLDQAKFIVSKMKEKGIKAFITRDKEWKKKRRGWRIRRLRMRKPWRKIIGGSYG
jgi:hypothetical protein